MKDNSEKIFIEALPLPKMKVKNTISKMYAKYNDGLLRFLKRRLNSKEDADEVAQEVYLRLIRYRRLNEIKPSLSILCKIASNLLIDRFRGQRLKNKYEHISSENMEITCPALSPEQFASSQEGIDLFNRVFEGWNATCQKVFLLNRFHGLTYKEIAQEIGISQSMVNKHISHALLQLREHFGKRL